MEKLPIPAVFLPALAALVGMVGVWIATGEFNREELALVVTGLLYALIGYPARGTLFQKPDAIEGTGRRTS